MLDLQLMPAGQHGFSHRQLVCCGSSIDILHHTTHHIQWLCRKARRNVSILLCSPIAPQRGLPESQAKTLRAKVKKGLRYYWP